MLWLLSAKTKAVKVCPKIPRPGNNSDRCPSSMIAKATLHVLSKTLHGPSASSANIFNVPSSVDKVARTSFMT